MVITKDELCNTWRESPLKNGMKMMERCSSGTIGLEVKRERNREMGEED